MAHVSYSPRSARLQHVRLSALSTRRSSHQAHLSAYSWRLSRDKHEADGNVGGTPETGSGNLRTASTIRPVFSEFAPLDGGIMICVRFTSRSSHASPTYCMSASGQYCGSRCHAPDALLSYLPAPPSRSQGCCNRNGYAPDDRVSR